MEFWEVSKELCVACPFLSICRTATPCSCMVPCSGLGGEVFSAMCLHGKRGRPWEVVLVRVVCQPIRSEEMFWEIPNVPAREERDKLAVRVKQGLTTGARDERKPRRYILHIFKTLI